MSSSKDDIKSAAFWRAIFAELIGTLFLTFVGCGSCIPWGELDEDRYDKYRPTIVQIALTFGLSVATMIWCIGHVSGGHINPAVTVAMVISRKISLARAILYIIAQCIGAIIGAALLKGVTPEQVRGNLGMTTINASLTPGQGFGVEFLVTFVLVLTVFASCDKTRTDLNGSAPLTIGLSVTLCHLFAIKYTGSSMNPARTFGPAVISGVWHEHWVYWIGPVLGGVLAGLVYEVTFAANASWSRAKSYLLENNYEPDAYEKVSTATRDQTQDKENGKLTELEESI